MAKDVPPVPRGPFVDLQTGRVSSAGLDFLERTLSRIGGAGNNVGWGGQVRVHKDGADQSVATSPITVIVTYSTATVDINGWYDLTNNRFVPKQKGTYFCFGRIGTKNGASTQAINNQLTKNGTVVAQGTTRISTAGGFACRPVWDIIELNGDTDYVDHQFRNVTSGTIDIDGDETQTTFIAWRWL